MNIPETKLGPIRNAYQNFEVKELHLFGSLAKGEATVQSDADFAVTFLHDR